MLRCSSLAVLLFLHLGCIHRTAAPEPGRDILTARAYIEADYDEVWGRFTRAEAFAEWYTVPCREFGLEPGDALIWADGERVVYRGRLLRVEKGFGISWEFRFIGFGFEEPMTPVDVEILERGATVLVSLRHDVTGAPRTSEIISPTGWAKPLSRLKTLLETERPMPWPAEPD